MGFRVGLPFGLASVGISWKDIGYIILGTVLVAGISTAWVEHRMLSADGVALSAQRQTIKMTKARLAYEVAKLQVIETRESQLIMHQARMRAVYAQEIRHSRILLKQELAQEPTTCRGKVRWAERVLSSLR